MRLRFETHRGLLTVVKLGCQLGERLFLCVDRRGQPRGSAVIAAMSWLSVSPHRGARRSRHASRGSRTASPGATLTRPPPRNTSPAVVATGTDTVAPGSGGLERLDNQGAPDEPRQRGAWGLRPCERRSRARAPGGTTSGKVAAAAEVSCSTKTRNVRHCDPRAGEPGNDVFMGLNDDLLEQLAEQGIDGPLEGPLDDQVVGHGAMLTRDTAPLGEEEPRRIAKRRATRLEFLE